MDPRQLRASRHLRCGPAGKALALVAEAIYGARARERQAKLQEIEQRCRECRLFAKARTGIEECGNKGGCNRDEQIAELPEREPLPSLDSSSLFVLEFFRSTAPRLYGVAGMSGVPHVPRHEIEVLARAWGLEWSEWLEEKYAICEDVYRAGMTNGE